MRNSEKSATTFATLMVAQPFAQLIIDKIKDVENRSKNCKIRGMVALYASRSKASWRFEGMEEMGFTYDPDGLDYGKILGFVEIVSVIEPGKRSSYKGEWHHKGSYGICISNVIKLKNPVSAKFPNGVINWGKLKGKALERCLEQLNPAQRKKLISSMEC